MLKPQNYDYIWSAHGWTYFDTSFWLVDEYLSRDFIITSKGNEWITYLGEVERERLSQLGLFFLQENFLNFKKEIKNKIGRTLKFFRDVSSKKFSLMSNEELQKDFLKTIRFVRSLWRPYFFTQYFLYDKIQRKVDENHEKNKYLLKRVKEMQKIKFQYRAILDKTMFKGNIFEKYFKEIQKRTKRKDLYSLHFKEIADLLRGKKLKKINRNNYVLGKFNNWKPIIGNKALKIIRLFEKEILYRDKIKQLISGQIANQGFYKGRARIIRHFDFKKNLIKKITEMKKGEVLISDSTGPRLILACKKAGAIITEEGGICSHAAIVSRELGIPCIIGTKIATRVLKDGDLVEVDANKGVVKILKNR